MRKISQIVVVFLAILVPCMAMAGVVRVPEDMPTIQAGIGAASDGDFVLVEPGEYDENIRFSGKNITVRSVLGPDETSIWGDHQDSVVTFYDGENSPVLEGFVIRDGIGKEVGTHRYGGGIYIWKSSPVIKNCKIVSNEVEGVGGGIYMNESEAMIVNSWVYNNLASTGGVGVYAKSSWPVAFNCLIAYNLGGEWANGGGWNQYGGGAEITNCTISQNLAHSGGGIKTALAELQITNCIIFQNGAISGRSFSPSTANAILTYTNVQDGWPGQGNIDVDPLFGSDYFDLQVDSPCVDAGDPDPIYFDMQFPPSQGTELNDMGVYGGPGAGDFYWGGQ